MKCIFKNLFSFIFIYIIESHVCLLRGQDNYITYDKTITNIISYEVLFELKQQQNLFLCLLFYPLQNALNSLLMTRCKNERRDEEEKNENRIHNLMQGDIETEIQRNRNVDCRLLK